MSTSDVLMSSVCRLLVFDADSVAEPVTHQLVGELLSLLFPSPSTGVVDVLCPRLNFLYGWCISEHRLSGLCGRHEMKPSPDPQLCNFS